MKKILHKIKSIQQRLVRIVLPRYVYRSVMLSSLYYFLFDKSFNREKMAVLAGKVKHVNDTEKMKSNYYMLVRNIHRIEKGLLMKPRRSIFAKAYIEETVNSFETIWDESQLKDNTQMKWFSDVLQEYFSSSGSDPLLGKLHERFINKINDNRFQNSLLEIDCRSIPYHRDLTQKSTISYDSFYKLTKQRRSVRWFLNKPIARELIDKAILAASQSPSACNRQPFEFRIFDDPELVEKIVEFPMGTKGYSHSIPIMIVIVGNLDAYFDERDRHIIYIDASLAAMSFMLALETMGLSSCPINWPDIEEKERKMESFLKLERYQRPIMCIGIGYPDPKGMVAFSAKRTLDQMRKYNNEKL